MTEPIAPDISAEIAKQAFVRAIFNLNDEGFNYVSWMVYQQAKTAGGFTDHEGWDRLREACEKLPYIAETQARFDAEYAKLDDAPPTVIQAIPDSTPEKPK